MTSAGGYWSSFARKFAVGVRADAAIYAAIGAYFFIGVLYMGSKHGFSIAELGTILEVYTGIWLTNYGLIFPLLLLIGIHVRITLRLERRRGLGYRATFSPHHVARFAAGSVLLMVGFLPFHVMFNAIKNAVPAQHGFASDHFLADFDKVLHFGVDPGAFLVKHLGSDWLLRAIEVNYNTVWLAICFGSIYWVAVSPRCAGVRLRYCLCTLLSWILAGNVLASMFPSAGPIYYGLVTGDAERFANVTQLVGSHVRQFISTADYQSYLWNLYVTHQAGLGSGISAFPSMHVSIVMLNALFIAEGSRKLALPAFGYVALIAFGSVYLGWHYAVDGYASIIVTVAIYWAVRKAMSLKWRWLPARAAAGAAAAN
jgi:hypothetical protein